MLMVLLLLQMAVIAVIVMVLWRFLEKELLAEALRTLNTRTAGKNVKEIVIVSARDLASPDKNRLQQLLARLFPEAATTLAVDRALKAGLIIKVGNDVLDYCLLTRLKHLWGPRDV